MAARAFFDSVRSLAFGSISGSYAAVGSPTDFPTRGICFTNTTDAAMFFSDDTGVSAGKILVPANSFKLWDIQANINPQFDDRYMYAAQTQWYVKQDSAPSSGSVYIEILY